MPEQYALFFTIGTSDAESGSDPWSPPIDMGTSDAQSGSGTSSTAMDLAPKVKDLKNLPHGIRKIFHYGNMYVCILNDSKLMKGKLYDFTEEEISKASAGKKLTEQEKISKVKGDTIIKSIIGSILPQFNVNDPKFRFRWALIPRDDLKWPNPAPTTKEGLIKKLAGTSGGGSEDK